MADARGWNRGRGPIPIFNESEREKFALFRELLGEFVFISAVWIVTAALHWLVKKALEYAYPVYDMPEPVQTILSAVSSVVIISIAIGYSIVSVVKIVRIVWVCIKMIWGRS